MFKQLITCLAVGLLMVTGNLYAEETAKKAPEPDVTPKPSAVLKIWPGPAPNVTPNGKPEVLDERGSYHDVSVPTLSIYAPVKDKANGTAVIICPGGGYAGLAVRLHVQNVVKRLNDEGITVICLKYRTGSQSGNVIEDALADAKRAVRVARDRARELGIDPHRIGVQGYSAGAHLCLNLASRFDEGDPKAADPIERLSSRPDFVALMCPWPFKNQLVDFPLSKNTPPVFIASARDDTTAPFSFATAIDERLKQLGVTESFFAVDTGGHNAFHFGVEPGPGGRWPDALIPWLRSVGMLGEKK